MRYILLSLVFIAGCMTSTIEPYKEINRSVITNIYTTDNGNSLVDWEHMYSHELSVDPKYAQINGFSHPIIEFKNYGAFVVPGQLLCSTPCHSQGTAIVGDSVIFTNEHNRNP